MERSPEERKQAIAELLDSDGWAILKELIDQRFGADAQLAEIDAAMKTLAPADTDGQFAVVTQIRAASKAAYVVLDLPKSYLRSVTDGEKKAPGLIDRFAHLRGRTA